jgi:rubrerythrin
MPLINFGSILNFAEEIEKQDLQFYTTAAGKPDCSDLKDLLEQFAKNCKKNIQTAQRTRRESVTEMILEPIRDFTRAPFQESMVDPADLDRAGVLTAAQKYEQRAVRYYEEAALKIKALPEVSRALKTMGKKRAAHIRGLEDRN